MSTSDRQAATARRSAASSRRRQAAVLEPADLLGAHRAAALLRAVDDVSAGLSRGGEAGLHVSSTGLEALLVGTALAARPSDWILPGVRQAPIALARGADPVAWFAHVLGRSGDPARGRQSPGGASWRSLNVVSAGAPVGSQLPHAVGVARAMKSAGRDDAALALAGHGCVSTGDFHVALNFAGVWSAPVVFIVARGGTLASQTATETVAEKAEAYGIEGVVIDGGDVEAVVEGVTAALARARAGDGPTLVDATVPDPPGPAFAASGPRALDEWTAADPLERLAARLASLDALSAEGAEQLRHEAEERAVEAAATARALPPVPRGTLLSDVHARRTPAQDAQRAELFRRGDA